MIEAYRFTCTVCGYSADVTGGEGEQLDEPSTTIECVACRALYEVKCPIVPMVGEVVLRSNMIT
jgi:hypothetical protein